MKQGWIKLHRRLEDCGWYQRSEYVHLWIHLLLNANHQPNEFLWNKKMIIIKEGQLLTGRKQLSEETGINESTIERILALFESEHQIEQQKTTKFRVITILNWREYQLGEQQNEQQQNFKKTTDEQQANTNKNDKNEENDKKTISKVEEKALSYKSLDDTQLELVRKQYFTDLLPIDSKQDFIFAWLDWCDYRKEKKNKLVASTAKRQIAKLMKCTDPVWVINRSIENGWIGLFDDENKNKTNTAPESKIIEPKYIPNDRFFGYKNQTALNEAIWNGEITPDGVRLK